MKIQNTVKALLIGTAILLTGCKGAPTVKYTTVKVERQEIKSSVTATGTIEPVTLVEVGTQVSGIISHIYVDYNSTVKKGQVIAELDRENLNSQLETAQAQLESAKSDLSYQEQNFERQKTLHDKGHISDNDFELARLSYQQAKATYNQRIQSVKTARTNLGYATITSPIDGIILTRAVEEGQTVASSFSTPTLFTIAKDLTDMRVIADIDEADIGGVREGQRVNFTVDAFPDDVFEGRVTQVRQEATTESSVVTYEVVISAPNPELKLKPGLTANVTIITKEVQNVLAVPVAALSFTPNENLLKDGETIADCQGKSKVWVREGNVIKAIPVETGENNGILAEIKNGLKGGEDVITEFCIEQRIQEEESGNQNPFMPHPGRNKNKKQ
ncbi:MAG: efflux RND transporter periplasmic adaptor subunit [Bacteroidales bacterium]|nr:efflux RND transporter periplasmic adaptor subunit [Bacteroidales bacterium]